MRTICLGLLPACLLCACAASTPDTREEAVELESACWRAMHAFRNANPRLDQRLAEVAGWAIFPDVGAAALGIGGAFGKGMAYDSSGRILGYVTISAATIGLQAGGQSYSELILFKTRPALRRLTADDFSLSADLTSGSPETAGYEDGIMVLAMDEKGLKPGIAVGGQKFDFVRR